MFFKFILLLLLPLITSAQLAFLPLSADYSVFQMNDSLAYVEIYVSIFQGNLNYQKNGDTLKASFETNLNIEVNGEQIQTKKHAFSSTITDTSRLSRYNHFNDIFKIALPFRQHTATIKVTDLNTGISGEYVMNINIPSPSEKFFLSDIELASNIKKAIEKSEFVKNGLTVHPYPRRTFDVLQPMLYYYVELNNLSHEPNQENNYSLYYFVTDDKGDTVKSSPNKIKTIAGKTQVEIGAFNTFSLPSGVYFLNIRAEDQASKTSSNTRKKFIISKPTKNKPSVAEKALDIDPVFSSLSVDELKTEFQTARYFATSEEDDVFTQLDSSNAMRTFLTNFWRKRDVQNKLPYGASRNQFMDLRRMADSKFGTSFTPGWKTDQGRVLIVYGQPSEIERFPNTIDTKPYLVWRYFSLEGGAEFIFCDRNGFGKYELIHSTYHKELNNPDWYRIISNNTSSGGFDQDFR